MGVSALICELRRLIACSLDILGFQADLGVESLGPPFPVAFHPFSTSCCQKLGWEERKEGTGSEGELTFWQLLFELILYLVSHLLGMSVDCTLREGMSPLIVGHAYHCGSVAACLVVTLDCGRGCLCLGPFCGAEIVSWPFTLCQTAALGGKRNDHGPLCRCSAQPSHPATHSLRDGFYSVVRPQDPGETKEHSSGLTHHLFSVASGLVHG